MQESALEKSFWRYWLAGILLFAVMVAMNPFISNDLVPWGIEDHQAAATAERVTAIHMRWQGDGVLWLARVSMATDLVFIAVYSWGAWLGGKVMRAEAGASLRRLGVVIMVASAVFFVTDYVETICQFIQVIQFTGSDALAGTAALVKPIKSFAWLVTLFGLLMALLFRRMARRAA
jgi:hypothetical protein